MDRRRGVRLQCGPICQATFMRLEEEAEMPNTDFDSDLQEIRALVASRAADLDTRWAELTSAVHEIALQARQIGRHVASRFVELEEGGPSYPSVDGQLVINRSKTGLWIHVAINDDVIACDMTATGLDDESLDVAVFSLSLMGANFTDYIREAHRALKLDGFLHIWEATSRFDDAERFARDLAKLGFERPRWSSAQANSCPRA